MTQEQKQIKIAEACGWTEIEPCTCHNGQARGFQPIKGAHKKHTPDYFNDLNAIHGAEKVLSDLNHGFFRRRLFTSYYNSGGDSDRRTNDEAERWRVSATATQRAEAFGLTLGLWK